MIARSIVCATMQLPVNWDFRVVYIFNISRLCEFCLLLLLIFFLFFFFHKKNAKVCFARLFDRFLCCFVESLILLNDLSDSQITCNAIRRCCNVLFIYIHYYCCCYGRVHYTEQWDRLDFDLNWMMTLLHKLFVCLLKSKNHLDYIALNRDYCWTSGSRQRSL